MKNCRDRERLAANYAKRLPKRIRAYLNARGIPDSSILYHSLGWNGSRITIPVYDREGRLVFFKLARDPDDDSDPPKMITSPGAYVELYGWEHVLGKPEKIVICEGEFDRLVLETQHYHAVISTGGAGTFREEWIPAFKDIPEVYVCYDRDRAGREGALNVARMIPHARIVELPEEVGDQGDVTDFFVWLGASRQDFEELLREAKPAPATAPTPAITASPEKFEGDRYRVTQIKNAIPIDKVIGAYLKLEKVGSTLRGLCPFHDERTPSLVVYPATNTYHCFGCRQHGDAISFLRAIEGLSFPDTLDLLEKLTHDHGRQAA